MTTIKTMPGAGESRLMKIRDLLGSRFHIPQFQRPYDWETRQVDEFAADLMEATRKRTPLFLGLVVAYGGPQAHAIIDGQQRLTTVMLALAAAGDAGIVLRADGGPTMPWIRPRTDDIDFARALLSGRREDAGTLSQHRMVSAFDHLAARALPRQALLDCEVIVYVAPYLAGATRLFERINLRGKRVSEFDLVKNRLIESAMQIPDEPARRATEDFVTSRYDKLYKLLDPRAGAQPFDSDKLLKLHWILFSPTQFKSGERVLQRLDDWLEDSPGPIASTIERYLESLVKVAQAWVSVERPYDFPRHERQLQSALLDFARLGREAELQPLIVAGVLAFGDAAHALVRFCEINSLRASLAQRKSNSGRSLKWRLARQLHARTLADARGRRITSPEGVVHQLFWRNTPWWSRDEAISFDDEISPEQSRSEILPAEALDNPKFLRQYRGLVHYLFWNYGRYLHTSKRWRDSVKVDISQFQEAVWFENNAACFRRWDIEHIYPQRPHDRATKDGARFQAGMKVWLNHLGNLTVLPIRDNRGVGNADFRGKLEWMQDQQKVPFNQLLTDRGYTGNWVDKPRWGPHNCRKRASWIRDFAAERWGADAVRELGVGDWDDRVDGDTDEDIELEEALSMTQLDALKQFEEFQPPLLRVHLTKHPEWSDYGAGYGLAAPQKLILEEAIDYVERMIDVAKQFHGLTDAMSGLEDLLQALQGADEDLPLEERDDGDDSDDDERRDAETDYAQGVRDSADSLIDSVARAQGDLAMDEGEREELDDDSRKAADALDTALANTMKLVNMLFEY